MTPVIELFLLGMVAFVQNMAFTWVSRSRNSGDPSYHFIAAVCSNGIWFVANILVWRQIWASLTAASVDWGLLVTTGIIYVAMTAAGSVFMMKFLLKREKGARRVGAYTSEPQPGKPMQRA